MHFFFWSEAHLLLFLHHSWPHVQTPCEWYSQSLHHSYLHSDSGRSMRDTVSRGKSRPCCTMLRSSRSFRRTSSSPQQRVSGMPSWVKVLSKTKKLRWKEMESSKKKEHCKRSSHLFFFHRARCKFNKQVNECMTAPIKLSKFPWKKSLLPFQANIFWGKWIFENCQLRISSILQKMLQCNRYQRKIFAPFFYMFQWVDCSSFSWIERLCTVKPGNYDHRMDWE